MAALAAAFLIGCGGGGGGGSASLPPTGSTTPIATATPVPTTPTPTPTATPTPTPTATPTVAPVALSGTVADKTTGAPLQGFTVTLGSLEDKLCWQRQTQTVNTCAQPAAPTVTTTTAADGTFSLVAPSTGKLFLVIAKDGSYAALHTPVTLVAGANPQGTIGLLSTTAPEVAWLADLNYRRANVAIPQSFGNLVIDEYLEETARQWAIDITAGKIAYTDAAAQTGYSDPYQSRVQTTWYGGWALDVSNNAFPDWTGAENAFWAEKANCPNGNWLTCPLLANTVHYLNVSGYYNSGMIGFGMSRTTVAQYPGQYMYGLFEAAQPQ